MASYHLYYLRDNKLVGSDSIEAANDGDAVRIARKRNDGQSVEVWNARNRVGVINAAMIAASR